MTVSSGFLGRPGEASSEASAKYFLLSILSSALFLLGVGMLYGQAGSMNFATITERMSALVDFEPLPRGLMVAFMLTFGALGFKIAAVPFHFYAPDVYAAATNANTGLLAVVPKVAGVVAIVRLLGLVAPVWSSFGWQVALVLSVLTMTLGNSCALWQTNVRRLLAYSSIAHAGYMLMGVAVAMAAPDIEGLFNGVTATLFYTFMYSFASLGAFAVLSALSSPGRELTDLKSLSGLYRQHPWLAASLAVCMFSLAGLPPLPGFWGKLGLLGGAVEVAGQGTSFSGWFTFLAVVGAINAAIGAAYYLRVVANTFFGEPQEAPTSSASTSGAAALVAVVAGALVVVLGCAPSYFIDRVSQAKGTVVADNDGPDTLLTAAPAPPDDRS
ncbi:MAG: NADH-quinone oxidoreductase subunit N [Planctomycetota bacterium]